ncbi:hypothetical protein H1P_5710001 [Hyella patelloides LEGE 07179]|uniref:Uncharacterized protein n=1 Tax=Hyella patelloides LEGE 07179 TaxID=945734 RepID=A0A563W0Q1_9CYAN|nr:hypothetical protein [Hyella patelloides]VEP17240.1 hypothetical protein H1P_5710001 [Hyella patelloides LEGE 07179]
MTDGSTRRRRVRRTSSENELGEPSLPQTITDGSRTRIRRTRSENQPDDSQPLLEEPELLENSITNTPLPRQSATDQKITTETRDEKYQVPMPQIHKNPMTLGIDQIKAELVEERRSAL